MGIQGYTHIKSLIRFFCKGITLFACEIRPFEICYFIRFNSEYNEILLTGEAIFVAKSHLSTPRLRAIISREN